MLHESAQQHAHGDEAALAQTLWHGCAHAMQAVNEGRAGLRLSEPSGRLRPAEVSTEEGMNVQCRIEGCGEAVHNKSSLCMAHMKIGRAQLANYVERFVRPSRFLKSNQRIEKFWKELADSVEHFMGRV